MNVCEIDYSTVSTVGPGVYRKILHLFCVGGVGGVGPLGAGLF